jgi:hypothetical protein
VSDLNTLIAEVERARRDYLGRVEELTSEQADFRPAPDAWTIAEITEHLVHAEWAGINLIWSAADGVRRGTPVWEGESGNRGLTIETIVERTWREKEIAPEPARPEWGGPLAYWTTALRACGTMLASLPLALEGLDLERIINPHPISGPLDAHQRLEFLRFHLDRHRHQVNRVRETAGW